MAWLHDIKAGAGSQTRQGAAGGDDIDERDMTVEPESQMTDEFKAELAKAEKAELAELARADKKLPAPQRLPPPVLDKSGYVKPPAWNPADICMRFAYTLDLMLEGKRDPDDPAAAAAAPSDAPAAAPAGAEGGAEGSAEGGGGLTGEVKEEVVPAVAVASTAKLVPTPPGTARGPSTARGAPSSSRRPTPGRRPR